MNASRTTISTSAVSSVSATRFSRLGWYDYSVVGLWVAVVSAIGASFLGAV